ncbi:MAG: hypothetical protein J5I93_20785, partial [Pirellulaceae bacterium]|nr:hypothetical protein [Pirellulaceae bacterium]
MSSVNWDVFSALPGAAGRNFETLCRALVRRHYGQFGTLRALSNQPGVEFHLHLQMSCSLGNTGRWYGWQCRWYDIPSGRSIGTRRRNKIAEAIAMTERVLPGVTDWVLWTRHPLTKGDQEWFFGLPTKMALHAWTSAEVEEHLCGPAEILKETYFGQVRARTLIDGGSITLFDGASSEGRSTGASPLCQCYQRWIQGTS